MLFTITLAAALILFTGQQAISLVLILGCMAMDMIYTNRFSFPWFDYMGYHLPLLYTPVAGFAHLPHLLIQRSIYIIAAFSLLLFSAAYYKRLPNNRNSKCLNLAGAAGLGLISIAISIGVFYSIETTKNERLAMVELNNRHISAPRLEVTHYDLDIEQQGSSLFVKAKLKGIGKDGENDYLFTLNPGFRVIKVTTDKGDCTFHQEKHQLWVHLKPVDNIVKFQITYKGVADPSVCYLDLAEDFLNTPRKWFFINFGKRYLFQTKRYIVLTPESYWYPRPGTAYSNKNHAWWQNQFSYYTLKIKTEKGLTALTQGACTSTSDETVSFIPETKLPNVSLLIGPYKSYQVEVDSTQYAIWYFPDNDYFRHSFDSITKELPRLIREVRQETENKLQLSYPFKRFSFIETPAYFTSYPRSHTQAQETTQPEMILMQERAHSLYTFNFKEQYKWYDRKIKEKRFFMTDAEIQAELFSGAMKILTTRQGKVSAQQKILGRKQYYIEENPYYLFPQLFSFRYNLLSPHYAGTNRLMEIFLQDKSNETDWVRATNGLTDNEKALMLIRTQPFNELLSDPVNYTLYNNIINLQADLLFEPALIQTGKKLLKKKIFEMLTPLSFQNISFECFLDSLSKSTNCSLATRMQLWKKPIAMTRFVTCEPVTSHFKQGREDYFQSELTVSNTSDTEGYLQYGLYFRSTGKRGPQDKPAVFYIRFKPHETLRLVHHWQEEPPVSYQLNTLFSDNLPAIFSLPAGDVMRNVQRTPEGIYAVDSSYLAVKDEWIVDNEDPGFFLSENPDEGLLPRWFQTSAGDKFRYAGFLSYNPPVRWTATTDQMYWGDAIRSSYVIKSGDGTQTATWNFSLPESGQYDCFYFMNRPQNWELNQNSMLPKEYSFVLEDSVEKQEITLNLNQIGNGWQYLGRFSLEGDSASLTLSNKTGLNYIVADAVKLVKIR